MTAVIYARYSSDNQREASIEGQLRDCKDYAEKNGITVVGTYSTSVPARTPSAATWKRCIRSWMAVPKHWNSPSKRIPLSRMCRLWT